MTISKTAVAAFIALTTLAACDKDKNETKDTTTIRGVDTTKGVAMPTTDTVVKTTTTDTIHGEVPRSAVSDAKAAKAGTRAGTKAVTKAAAKKGY